MYSITNISGVVVRVENNNSIHFVDCVTEKEDETEDEWVLQDDSVSIVIF